jgi:hypothetical protein
MRLVIRRIGSQLFVPAITFVAALLPGTSWSQSTGDGTSAEFFIGSAWSLPLPLRLSDAPRSVRIRPRYTTRPFRDAPYYAVRLGHLNDGRGFEAELIHHKLYLENPAPPIDRLEITHGYNLAMINAAGPAGGWQFRAGIGLVIAHPEGRIAGQVITAKERTVLGGGYHVAGGTLQLALGRRYALTSGNVALTAAPEVKLTAAFARMHLTQGTLHVPNVAVHALAGIGILNRSW